MMTYTCTVETPLGAMTAAAENDALVGLWFIGQRYYPSVYDPLGQRSRPPRLHHAQAPPLPLLLRRGKHRAIFHLRRRDLLSRWRCGMR